MATWHVDSSDDSSEGGPRKEVVSTRLFENEEHAKRWVAQQLATHLEECYDLADLAAQAREHVQNQEEEWLHTDLRRLYDALVFRPSPLRDKYYSPEAPLDALDAFVAPEVRCDLAAMEILWSVVTNMTEKGRLRDEQQMHREYNYHIWNLGKESPMSLADLEAEERKSVPVLPPAPEGAGPALLQELRDAEEAVETLRERLGDVDHLTVKEWTALKDDLEWALIQLRRVEKETQPLEAKRAAHLFCAQQYQLPEERMAESVEED